jgi:hypothetical protein
VSGERFFEELGAELERAARAKLDAGTTEPAGHWGRVRSSLAAGRRAAPTAVGVGVALAAVVGVFLLIAGVRHRPRPAPTPRPVAVTLPGLPIDPTRRPSAEQRYIDNAWLSVERRDPGCVPRQPTVKFSDGAPSRTLLSSLGVLRLPAGPNDAAFASEHGPEPGTQVYRRYVHLARVMQFSSPALAGPQVGYSYYLVPAGNVVGAVPGPAHCYADQAAALQAELETVSPGVRGSATRLAAQERYDDQHPEGIGVEAQGPGPGDTYAGTTRELQQRGLLGAAVPIGSATVVSGVVPDGVANVTLHYPPAAHAGRVAPVFTVTEHPINNVFVASLPRAFGVNSPDKVTWRARNGRVIRTILTTSQGSLK